MITQAPLQDNITVDKTFKCAVSILKFFQILQEERYFVLSNQLLKSGTLIGANTREAQNAESKPDFIHKFKIAAKEADEKEYWLLLCQEVPKKSTFQILLDHPKAVQKIITKTITTTKNQLVNKLTDK